MKSKRNQIKIKSRKGRTQNKCRIKRTRKIGGALGFFNPFKELSKQYYGPRRNTTPLSNNNEATVNTFYSKKNTTYPIITTGTNGEIISEDQNGTKTTTFKKEDNGDILQKTTYRDGKEVTKYKHDSDIDTVTIEANGEKKTTFNQGKRCVSEEITHPDGETNIVYFNGHTDYFGKKKRIQHF
jgi:hypothetical protein